MYNRLQKAGALSGCIGNLGVNTFCTYKGVSFVLSGAGTEGINHSDFMTSAFAVFGSIWRIAAWHKNQHLMQLGLKRKKSHTKKKKCKIIFFQIKGDKLDETGWKVYETARMNGAIIATGHEHSYCRSKPMTDFETQTFENVSTNFLVGSGKTYVHVTGTGGRPIRPCTDNSQYQPWWAVALCNNVSKNYSSAIDF